MIAQDFMTLALRLIGGGTEAEWRSAISRAYYAVFHSARQLLSELGFAVPRDDNAHRYLINRLSNSKHPSASRVGRALDRLRGDRNSADYDLHRVWAARLAAQSVQLAEQMMQTLAAIRKGPDRQALTDAMKDYERNVLGVVTWQPPSSP